MPFSIRNCRNTPASFALLVCVRNWPRTAVLHPEPESFGHETEEALLSGLAICIGLPRSRLRLLSKVCDCYWRALPAIPCTHIKSSRELGIISHYASEDGALASHTRHAASHAARGRRAHLQPRTASGRATARARACRHRETARLFRRSCSASQPTRATRTRPAQIGFLYRQPRLGRLLPLLARHERRHDPLVVGGSDLDGNLVLVQPILLGPLGRGEPLGSGELGREEQPHKDEDAHRYCEDSEGLDAVHQRDE
jgi:hypothetical protein